MENETYGSNCQMIENETQQIIDVMEHVGYVYIIPVISLFGVILNVLNLFVLCGKHSPLKGSSYAYLKALAVADGLTCLIVAPIAFVRCTNCVGEDLYTRAFYEVYIYLPFGNIFGTCSAWITVAVAVERCIMIKFPVKSKKICKSSVVWKVVGLLVLCSMAANVMYFFQNYINSSNVKTPTPISLDTGFFVLSWIRAALTKFIPIILLAVLNIYLIKHVYKMEKKRKSMVIQQTVQMRKQRTQVRLAAMLIAVVFAFLIGSIPVTFAHTIIYKGIFGECSLFKLEYFAFRLVANILEILNYTMNFVLYCLLNTNFNARLHSIFSCGSEIKVQAEFSMSHQGQSGPYPEGQQSDDNSIGSRF